MVIRKVFAPHESFSGRALNVVARVISKSGAGEYGKKVTSAEDARGKDWKHPRAQKLFRHYIENYLFRNSLSTKKRFNSLFSNSSKIYFVEGIKTLAVQKAVKMEVFRFVVDVSRAKRVDRVKVVEELLQELDSFEKRLDEIVSLNQTGEGISKIEQAGRYKINSDDVKYYRANASDAIGHMAPEYATFLGLIPILREAAKGLKEVFNYHE